MRRIGFIALLLPIILGVPGASEFTQHSQSAPARAIRGRITDARGSLPVVGTKIIVVGTTAGSVTDSQGVFQITSAPTGNRRVFVQHPCYYPVEVTIPADGDVVVALGMPFDQSALGRAGCGGLGGRRDSMPEPPR